MYFKAKNVKKLTLRKLPTTRTKRLLKTLMTKSRDELAGFRTAFERTGQHHIVVFLDRDGGELSISLHDEGDGLPSCKPNDSGDSVIFKTGVDVRKFLYSLVMSLG